MRHIPLVLTNFLYGIVKRKKLLLALYLLIVAVCGWQALQLEFEHKRDRFFPADNEDLAFLRKYFNKIEHDDIFVLCGFRFDESALEEDNLHKLDSFSKKAAQIPQVVQTVSLLNSQGLKKGGFKVYPFPLLSRKSSNRARDSLRLSENPYVVGNLISPDFKAVNVVLKTQAIVRQSQADSLYDELQLLVKKFDFEEAHLSGFPIIQSITVRALKDEMTLYVAISCILLVVVMLFIYRSVWGLFVPFLCLFGGLAVFFAFLKLSGQSLDVMSTLYPILMLIFLMADIIHLQTHYIDQLHLGKSPKDALICSIREIGMALFLTSFTTAVGFGTLISSRIEAIRHFGANAAAGVMIAYIIVLIFGSSALLFFKKGMLNKAREQNAAWERAMDRIFSINKKQHRKIALISFSVCIVAVFGISKVSTNAFIKGELPDRQELYRDFEFFEDNFGGVRSFEMAVLPAEGRDLFDPEVLSAIARVEQYLKDSQQMKQVVSPTIGVRYLHYAYSRAKAGYTFPEDSQQIRRYAALASAYAANTAKNLSSQDGTFGRISARLRDEGSNFHEKQNEEIEQWVTKHIDSSLATMRVTGTNLMYDRNHAYLRKSLFRTLGLAFVIVGLLFAVLFRDWRMLIISIIPNMIPLLLAAAAMGFLNIKLQALTSIFFAISFGIAVDDTIHFLTRFKLERKKGKTIDKAIRTSLQISGKAIILTSIILISSFFTLTTSDFKGTYYIGVLVSITLLAAVLADLFVLPQLIYLISGRKIRSERRKRRKKE